jgi:ABC-type transporter Mla subunit MlaD
VQGQQMQKLLANAGMAADQFATAAARLPALIASVQATAQRAGNGTADVEQGLIPLLRDMQATAQNLRQMTDELRRYPAQVFAQPPPRASEPVR